MSLRDQLLKAGLVDKKKVQQTNRELKDARKQGQGNQRRKKDLQREQAAAEEAARQATVQARLQERLAALARREAADRARLVANLLRAYATPLRDGHQRFFHKAPNGHTVHRLMIAASQAWDLRQGKLALVWTGEDAEDPAYILLPGPVAERVLQHAADRVLFYNATPPDKDDPAEQLLEG